METSQNHSQQQEEINRFRVVIRVRPFLEEELTGGKKGKHQCTQFYSVIYLEQQSQQDNQSLSLIRPNYDQRDFYFDQVLNHQQDQETAYDQIAYPVVQDVLNGFNGVVMAYGQTGSGKTHTIFGSRPSLDHLYSNKDNKNLHYECGIVPRCVSHIFDYIQENPNKAQFRITVSFLEIYMEQITDLLLSQTSSQTNFNNTNENNNARSSSHTRQASHSPIRTGNSSSSLNNVQGQNLKLREDPKTGIFVDGLTQVNVKSKEQLYQLIKIGAKRRSVNQTAMNKNSSRSHAVLQIFVEQRWVEKSGGDNSGISEQSPPAKKDRGQVKKRHYKKALLTVVDLAGSERLSKTGSEGMRLQEAKNINKSIAALSNCISALASDKPLLHVPFRDSKLTRLLTDSLGGNSKTTICACISPSLIHYEESYSTLLFAQRAMSVRTYVTMNEKIEYKMVDDQGRSVNPSQSKLITQQTPNEKILLKQNSKLQEETEGLRMEIETLREQIKKQSTNNINGTPGTPYNQMGMMGSGIMYNSNHTQNTSMDGNQPGISYNNWSLKYNQPQPQSRNNMPMMARSLSPPPTYTAPMMMHQNSNFNNQSPQKPIHQQQHSTPIYQPPHQAQQQIYMNGQNPQLLISQITPQESEHFSTADRYIPNNNAKNINQPLSQQLYLQQQNDSSLLQKLSAIIDSLQSQVMSQQIQIDTLKDENNKLKRETLIGSGSNTETRIDEIINNEAMKRILFEKLAKMQYAQQNMNQ